MTIAFKPQIPFLWGIFFRLDSYSSCSVVHRRTPSDHRWFKKGFPFRIQVIRSSLIEPRAVTVFLTSSYDYVALTHGIWTDLTPWTNTFNFGRQEAVVNFKESTIDRVKCKQNDQNYKSVQQCFASIIDSHSFSLCPKRCIPAFWRGIRYILKSDASIHDCTTLHELRCIWETYNKEVMEEFMKCEKPCHVFEYSADIQYFGFRESEYTSLLRFQPNIQRTVRREIYVYDFSALFGNVGGSMGLFFGFSIFGLSTAFIDWLINLVIDFKTKRKFLVNSK